VVNLDDVEAVADILLKFAVPIKQIAASRSEIVAR